MKKNTRLFKGLITLLSIALGGCGYNHNSTPHAWLSHYNLATEINPDNLSLCIDFGCRTVRQSRITAEELQRITALFQPEAETAEQERHKIAQAIALLETQQGQKLGTANDLAKNDFSFSGDNQLDCIAETSNTSVYLLLLADMQLLKFHQPTGRAHRGPITLNMPHNSATIKELSSGNAYVVDSWYTANGELPWVTSVEHWLTGAAPEK